MLLDKELLFDDGVTMVAGSTGAVATHVSVTALDLLQPAPRQIGDGEPIRAFINIDTTFTSGGSATVNFQLVNSATLSTLGTPTVIASTGAIAVASLVAGYRAVWTLPRSGILLRYIGVLRIIAVDTITAGKVTTGLIDGVDSLVKAPAPAWVGVDSPSGGGWV